MHTCDAAAFILRKTVFLCFTFCIQRRIVRTQYILLKGVYGKIVICRTDIRVSQHLSGGVDGGMIVADLIFMILNQMHAEFVLKISKHFTFISCHNEDFRNACLQKLPDLALNKHLTAYIQKCFRRCIGKRSESRSKSCSQNYSIVNTVLLDHFIISLFDILIKFLFSHNFSP